MERNLHDIPLDTLNLNPGALTELHSMGIFSVGEALALLTASEVAADTSQDLTFGDLDDLEEALVAAGYADYLDVVPDGYSEIGDLPEDDDDVGINDI